MALKAVPDVVAIDALSKSSYRCSNLKMDASISRQNGDNYNGSRFLSGRTLFFDEQGQLTRTGYPNGINQPSRRMACTTLYIDDSGQVWLGWFTRPNHTDHVEMAVPPQRAPDNWTDFLPDKNDMGRAYPVLPPPKGWTPDFGG